MNRRSFVACLAALPGLSWLVRKEPEPSKMLDTFTTYTASTGPTYQGEKVPFRPAFDELDERRRYEKWVDWNASMEKELWGP